MAKVCQKTGKKELEVLDELRQQVLGVLKSMREPSSMLRTSST